MIEHREVMQKNLEAQQCWCCEDVFFNLIVHHIDGNRKNNKQKNLIVLCKRCHALVHHGLNKKWFSFRNERNNNLLELRKIWLANKKNITKKKAQEILNYERWILGQCWISPKSQCNLCKKNNNLIYYIPKDIKKMIPENKHKTYGIVYCKFCLRKLLKDMKPYL